MANDGVALKETTPDYCLGNRDHHYTSKQVILFPPESIASVGYARQPGPKVVLKQF
jgi:hypothetical protein